MFQEYVGAIFLFSEPQVDLEKQEFGTWYGAIIFVLQNPLGVGNQQHSLHQLPVFQHTSKGGSSFARFPFVVGECRYPYFEAFTPSVQKTNPKPELLRHFWWEIPYTKRAFEQRETYPYLTFHGSS